MDGCEPDCTFTCMSGSGAFRTSFSGSTCYASFLAKTAWHDAETACVALGGQLEVIPDAEVDGLVRSLVNPGNGVWIGLSDEAVEGTFAWINGAPLDYASWGSGEPNDSGGVWVIGCRASGAPWQRLTAVPSPQLALPIGGPPGVTAVTSGF